MAGKWIAEAEAILICSGSGSLSAPLQSPGSRVFSSEEDFASHYPAMSEWGYKTAVDCQEILTDGKLSIYEQWGFWAEHASKIKSSPVDSKTLETLGRIVGEKDYFIYSSSADPFFERAGFDDRRIYPAAGSWEYYQCAQACSSGSVFPAGPAMATILASLEDYGVVTNDCLPCCPLCGASCVPNVRLNDLFLHDRYDASLSALIAWLESLYEKKTRLLVLELDGACEATRLCSFVMESIAKDLGRLVRFSPERYPWVPAVLPEAVGLPCKSFQDLPQLLSEGAVLDVLIEFLFISSSFPFQFILFHFISFKQSRLDGLTYRKVGSSHVESP